MRHNRTLRQIHRAMTRPVVPLSNDHTELYAVTNYTLLFGIAAYLSFIPLFWAVGAEFIAALNLGVIACLAIALWIVRKGRLFAGMVFISTLVVSHAWITTATLGWDAAFHLHAVLALELGMLFTWVPVRTRLIFAATVVIAYLGMLVSAWYIPPSVALSQGWQRSLAITNSIVFLGVTIGMAAYYAWMVRRNREKREKTLDSLADSNERLRTSEEALAVARDEAEEASRAKSMFLANMSHELRTPLNAIIGYSEMLAEEAEDEENTGLAEEVEKIRGAGRHLLSLINDILDLSKVEAGRMEVEYLDFDLNACVNEVVNTARPLAQANGNRLLVEVDEAVGQMHGDPTKVRQILFNLLSNACKFTTQGEVALTVQTQTEEGRDGVRFAVRDTGLGIPAETLERIFTEFAQAESSTTRKFGGTGLGLAITRSFCDLLGGSIGVESTPGEGSTFTVWLPHTAQPDEI